MQLSTASDVQIYNLSAGRSLPKWLSSEAKRKLEKKNIDVRRRIELIQDFEMPDISHTVDVTPDGRYIFATGAYRPSLKCYDLNDLSIKFERGLDADVVKLLVLSDDFSKDRYLEMHAAFGRYFRMRMPRFGRDMAFSKECSDLYLVGASSDIYRLNLEQGGWLSPLQSHSPGINCCSFANDHQLFVCGSSLPDSAVFLVPGTNDGKVEAWDHRDKTRVGVLDCVIPLLEEHTSAEVTSLQFRDGLHLGVGMSTGHVLLYDLRSHRPLVVKDHNYGQPIKKIDYVAREEGNIVLSMDSRVLKMWHEENGKPFAAIESETPLTDFARYPNSGLLFFSNETSRMQQHFVPALGPAPKWCSFLETLTEELEETEAPTVYDDYKFVTRQQLEGLGLSQLIGTSVLRAYMHGYFIDARLYNKAQTLTQPFAYDKYKDRKVKDILDAERETSLVVKKTNLPKVNKNIALRLQKSADAVSTKTKDKKKAMTASSILEDSRFKKLFENEDFQVDEESDPFKHISTQADRDRRKTGAVEVEEDSGNDEEDEPIETTLPGDEEVRDDTMRQSDIESENTDNEEEEEKKEKQKERERRKQLTREKRAQKYVQRKEAEENEKIERLASKPKKFVLHDLANGETSKKFIEKEKIETAQKELPMSIKKRKIRKPGQLEHVEETDFGGRSMTFVLEKRGKAAREERDKTKREEHQKERKELVRRTTDHVAKNMKRLPSNLNLKRTQKH